jgi:hypothetical protein
MGGVLEQLAAPKKKKITEGSDGSFTMETV